MFTSVRTVSRNISLSPELDAFVREESEAKGYGSLSAYFQELVRERYLQRAEEDAAELAKGIEGAPTNESQALPAILAAQKRVRKRLRRHAQS